MSSNHINHCHHDALVSISDHRDLDTLSQELVHSLETVFAGHRVRFYACDEQNNYIVPDNDKDVFTLLQKITTEEPVIIDKPASNEYFYLFPIYANNKRIAALVLEGEALEQSFSLINSFISLYANQFTLLNSSNRDALTSLYNRQAFDQMVGKILAEYTAPKRRSSDTSAEYFFALLDIDRFKVINDNFGHLFGDEVLLHFSQIMTRSFRDNDLLFRYGGEEFAIALQTEDADIAHRVFERFRYNIEHYEFPQVGHVTASIGYTKISENMLVTTLTERADKALYYAKEHGRNKVCCYEDLIERGELQKKTTETDIEFF